MLKKSQQQEEKSGPAIDWHSVLLSPDIVDSGADGKNHKGRAIDFLDKKVSKANQAFIADVLGLDISDSNRSFALGLMHSAACQYLTRLCAFARQSGVLAAAHEQYETTFSTQDKKRHRASIEALSGRSNQELHAFSRLIVLIDLEPTNIEKVFLRSKWRSRATRQAFIATKSMTLDTVEGLQNNAAQLAERFASRGSKSSARLFLDAEIQPGLHVFLFQRELAARQQVDYRNGLTIHHGFGWVLFGIDRNTGRIAFKGGGAENANIVCGWIAENTQDLQFQPEGSLPFSAYDVEKVADSLLGVYPVVNQIDD